MPIILLLSNLRWVLSRNQLNLVGLVTMFNCSYYIMDSICYKIQIVCTFLLDSHKLNAILCSISIISPRLVYSFLVLINFWSKVWSIWIGSLAPVLANISCIISAVSETSAVSNCMIGLYCLSGTSKADANIWYMRVRVCARARALTDISDVCVCALTDIYNIALEPCCLVAWA